MFGLEDLSWGLSDEEQYILESAAIEATHRQRANSFHRVGQRYVVEVEPDLYFVIHRHAFRARQNPRSERSRTAALRRALRPLSRLLTRRDQLPQFRGAGLVPAGINQPARPESSKGSALRPSLSPLRG